MMEFIYYGVMGVLVVFLIYMFITGFLDKMRG